MGEIVVASDVPNTTRAIRSSEWTCKKRAAFLDWFAGTCNVQASCVRVGMSRQSLRQLRQRDAEFARLYDAARLEAHERLEEAVLARALVGAPGGDNPTGERADVEPVEFDVDLAFRTLKLRDGSPGRAGSKLAPAATQEQLDATLMKRLAAMARMAVARDGDTGT